MNDKKRRKSNQSARSLSITLRLLAVSLLALMVIGTGSLAVAYETPELLSARDILSPKLLKGQHHTVLDEVFNDGLTNEFTITSPYGQFKAFGESMLRIRIQEIRALAKMEELQNSKQFGEGVKEGVKAPFKAVKGLVTDPIDTVTGMGRGVGRFFGRVGEMVTGERGELEEGVTKELIGFAGVKRKLAYQLGVDVYSSNAVLQEKLNSLTWAGFSGGMTVNLLTLAVLPAPAAQAIQATKLTRNMNLILRDNAPEDLRKLNRAELRAMNVPEWMIERFLEHPWYSPRHETVIVHALAEMTGTRDRQEFIRLTLLAASEEDAFFFQQVAEMLAGYHANVRPIRAITKAGRRMPSGFVGLDTLVVTVPADYVYLTYPVAVGAQKIRHAQALDPALKIEIWLSGRMTTTAKQYVQDKRMEVHEMAASTLLPPAKGTPAK